MSAIITTPPPSAINFEQAILGAILHDYRSADEVIAIIATEDIFYDPKHMNIFKAILSLYSQGNPIDLLSVANELRKLGLNDLAGGEGYLMILQQRISSAAHVEYHCRIVLQKYMARQTILFSQKIITLAYDESTDIFELMQRWQKEFDNVSDYINTGRTTMSFPSALSNLKKEIELLTANKDEVQLVGIDTGFKRLNKYTGGYRNQDLVVVAARPGMGKTAYVLKAAIENCKKGVGVGMISLEMSMEQLAARSVAIDTNFHLKQLLKTGFEHSSYFQTYTMHQERMNLYPFFVDDSGKTDVTDVVITARLWVRKHNIKLLIIDYIQLMTDRSVKGNRESEISSISRRLKRLAKELNIPVIALSQLSRAVETRGSSKRPMLSDLRESGAIEQDADIVQFLYRPDYYKIEMNEEDYDGTLAQLIPMGANSEVIFAKYRGGSVGTTLLKWIGDKTKFIDVEDVTDVAEYIDNEVKPLSLGSVTEAFDVSSDDKEKVPF